MKVTILSSSSNMDNKYIAIAKDVSNVFINYDYDLVFGGSDTSMMGTCYKIFKENNKEIYAYSNYKYKEYMDKLDCHKIFVDNTFNLKQELFNSSDILVSLPGGLGTVSEILSFIEEKRSNDIDKPFIIYDPYNDYKLLIELIGYLKEKNFLNFDLNDYIMIFNNINDLDNYLKESVNKKRI